MTNSDVVRMVGGGVVVEAAREGSGGNVQNAWLVLLDAFGGQEALARDAVVDACERKGVAVGPLLATLDASI